MRRAEHRIELLTKDGQTVNATVKRPTIELSSKVDELTIEITMLAEQRTPLWQGTVSVNRTLALTQAAYDSAPDDKKKEAQADLDDAKGAYDALRKQIEKKDKALRDKLIEQATLVVNIPKGDAEAAPEIDWENSDLDNIKEAIHFFRTGKLDLPTKSAAAN